MDGSATSDKIILIMSKKMTKRKVNETKNHNQRHQSVVGVVQHIAKYNMINMTT